MIRTSTTIAASADKIWATMLAIESWPDWTPTATAASWVDPGPTAVGRRARVTQPRLGTAEWTVIELAPDASFVWARRSAGVRTVGGHYLTPGPDGSTVLTLSVEHTGPLAGLVRLLTDRLTRRYVIAEADGLKSRCE